ncbi:MAG: MBL fold metallo-hydrolase [Proteobacteria bacterium]|nr:MBL fold metallo-hydrolase [Pseudomonadota bacterium]MBU1742980.1 MBL fold metallo-hydrolase [Pseudomonadota bacterium]
MTWEPILLDDHLWLVPGENQGRFPRSHSFLIQDDLSALIDTGCGLGRLEELKTRYRIDLVINSHSHPDHAAGNRVFSEKPLVVPIQGARTAGRVYPLSHRLVDPGELAVAWRRFVREDMDYHDQWPTAVFDHGHVFDFGHLKLEAIHAPGHLADHYVFWEPKSRTMLSFDIDLTPWGPWYGHRESDISAFRHSIEVIRKLAPKRIVSSHHHPVSDNVGRALDDYEEVFDKRAAKILSLLDGPRTLDELAATAPIYGKFSYVPEIMFYWERLMIEKHLDLLEREGRVVRRGERFAATK